MLRRVIFFTILAAVSVPGAVLAADSFTFEGGGSGHGVGMSQWGAYGQSQADSSRSGEDIAAYYYPGSQAASLSELDLPNDLLRSLENPIWVNLARQIEILELTPVGGPLELCLAGDGEGSCPKPEQPQEGERWQFRRIARGECGFFKDGELQGTAGDCRAAISWPEAEGVRLRYGDERLKPCIVSRSECEYRHGELKIRDDPVEVGFHVVLAIGLEDYVRGIAEIFSSWTTPGVNEAQAVTARTYAAFKFFANEVEPRPSNPNADPGLRASRKDSCWCHLYDNTRDQVYVGWWREGPDHAAWTSAVERTRDRVITYFGPDWERYTKRGIIQAFFSASSGGTTNSNVSGFFTEWDGVPSRVNRWPYLVPVEDPWDVDPALGNPHASWRASVSSSKIAASLGWDEVTAVTLEAAATLRSPARVRFDGVDGGAQVSRTATGAWLRYGLGLKSSNITAIDDRPAPPVDPSDEPDDTGGHQVQEPDADIPYDELPPFRDIQGSPHEEGIIAIRKAGAATGCGDYDLDFCPEHLINRSTVAAFLTTMLARDHDLPKLSRPYERAFEDVPDDHPHAPAIYTLAAVGVTTGCGDGTRFCPRDSLTRGAMASFLARALDLELSDSFDGWRFQDVSDEHAHRGSIYAIARAGITVGCGDGTRFCPDKPLTRGEIATFLARAFLWGGSSPPDGDE